MVLVLNMCWSSGLPYVLIMYGSMTSPVLLPPGGLGRVCPLITCCEEGEREGGREGGRERERGKEREREGGRERERGRMRMSKEG